MATAAVGDGNHRVTVYVVDGVVTVTVDSIVQVLHNEGHHQLATKLTLTVSKAVLADLRRQLAGRQQHKGWRRWLATRY